MNSINWSYKKDLLLKQNRMKQLNEPLSEAIIRYLRASSKNIKRNLLSLFIEGVYALEGGTPNNLSELLFDLKELFVLLDTIEDEIEKCKVSKGSLLYSLMNNIIMYKNI